MIYRDIDRYVVGKTNASIWSGYINNKENVIFKIKGSAAASTPQGNKPFKIIWKFKTNLNIAIPLFQKNNFKHPNGFNLRLCRG